MAITRCRDCGHYNKWGCRILSEFLNIELGDGFVCVEAIIPKPDFGCILWESKETYYKRAFINEPVRIY